VAAYSEMTAKLAAGDAGFFLAPWKCDEANEDAIKTDCKATIRCYPFAHNAPGAVAGKKCFYSGEDATHMALFARAF
jgi:prolyl-tRNA synthetase